MANEERVDAIQKKEPERAEQLREMKDGEPIWKWMERMRRENGIRLDDAAEKLGVNRMTISAWLNGQTAITEDQLKRFCEALGISCPFPPPRPQPMTPDAIVGWLKSELRWAGITGREAGKTIGIDASVLAKMLNGSMPMTPKVYKGLCGIVGCYPQMETVFYAEARKATARNPSNAAEDLEGNIEEAEQLPFTVQEAGEVLAKSAGAAAKSLETFAAEAADAEAAERAEAAAFRKALFENSALARGGGDALMAESEQRFAEQANAKPEEAEKPKGWSLYRDGVEIWRFRDPAHILLLIVTMMDELADEVARDGGNA